ncbi:hypothetical protein VNO77_33281 [Canavalia gladiata]|uniref:Uncharacterized protein n=1 Tax=Canavalia gladiata TaxID=3824 RepID=A0AAN9KDK8_CANGL
MKCFDDNCSDLVHCLVGAWIGGRGMKCVDDNCSDLVQIAGRYLDLGEHFADASIKRKEADSYYAIVSKMTGLVSVFHDSLFRRLLFRTLILAYSEYSRVQKYFGLEYFQQRNTVFNMILPDNMLFGILSRDKKSVIYCVLNWPITIVPRFKTCDTG